MRGEPAEDYCDPGEKTENKKMQIFLYFIPTSLQVQLVSNWFLEGGRFIEKNGFYVSV